MGAVDLPGYDLEGVPIIVDGHYGEVYTNPSKERSQESRTRIAEQKLFEEELEELKDLPCITQDGWRVQLWVNIGLNRTLPAHWIEARKASACSVPKCRL